MPKHEPKVDPTTYSSAIADSPDDPSRVNGEQSVPEIEHDLKAFVAAIDKAVQDGVPHGVLLRRVEQHHWDSAPAVR